MAGLQHRTGLGRTLSLRLQDGMEGSGDGGTGGRTARAGSGTAGNGGGEGSPGERRGTAHPSGAEEPTENMSTSGAWRGAAPWPGCALRTRAEWAPRPQHPTCHRPSPVGGSGDRPLLLAWVTCDHRLPGAARKSKHPLSQGKRRQMVRIKHTSG